LPALDAVHVTVKVPVVPLKLLALSIQLRPVDGVTVAVIATAPPDGLLNEQLDVPLPPTGIVKLSGEQVKLIAAGGVTW
jgi:hypothetical protein